jgi:4-aminobutyrate aminotransferase/(S)-3-amino-2-methylpropionate transaminase
MTVLDETDTGLPQRRELVTEIPGPRSLAIHERRLRAVATGVSSTLPAYIETASGSILRDVDGNSLIDLGSGIAVTSVGHTAPRVVEAVRDQVGHLIHSCFMVTPYEPYVAVAEALNELTPGDFDKTTALFNSGAEAVENAVKIARHHTRRSAVVVFDHAYHGRTNLTMALTAKNMPYKHGFGPFAPEIYRASLSYPYRDPHGLSGRDAAVRSLAEVESQVGAANVACVLIEPIQGEGGFIVPAPGFLAAIAEWCAHHGAVFIADEIQTGFCRTGAWFACEHEGVVPDLITTAKGIAGGMPLAAVTGRAEIMNSVHEGGLGGTYGGNPVAAAAALGSIATMRELNLADRARHLGEIILGRFDELAGELAGIGDVRGRGAMCALELVVPGTTDPDPVATKRVAALCHQQGVVVLTCGTYGNVVRLLPPLVIGDDLLDEGLSVLEGALREVLGSR